MCYLVLTDWFIDRILNKSLIIANKHLLKCCMNGSMYILIENVNKIYLN